VSGFLLVSAGGFVGANLRYAISVWSARRYGTEFPTGTLIANLGGSLLMGFVLGLLSGWVADDQQIRLLVATGFLGAETTFSTYTYQTVAMIRYRQVRSAVSYFLGSAALGLLATTLGLLIAYVLTDVIW
jgi:fluoride exporter